MPTKQGISDLKERLARMSERAEKQKGLANSEDATKAALIRPFLEDVLGFDTTNLAEVMPEHTAQIDGNQEKVDYAILKDGKAVMPIEAKKYGDSLENHVTQLRKYLAALSKAPVGLLTDGVKYLFFQHIDRVDVDDMEPFFEFNLLCYTDEDVRHISFFTKERIAVAEPEATIESLRESLLEFQHIRDIRREIVKEICEPSSVLARHFASKVNAYETPFTKLKAERFQRLTALAFKQVIEEEARKALAAAQAHQEEQPPSSSEAHSSQDDAVVEPSQQINTVNKDPEVPAPSGGKRRFDLLAMGIPVGAQLDYHKGGHQAFVTGSNTVEYQGKEMKLIDATKPLVGRKAIRPIAHWLYKGRPLQKCYDEWVERG